MVAPEEAGTRGCPLASTHMRTPTHAKPCTPESLLRSLGHKHGNQGLVIAQVHKTEWLSPGRSHSIHLCPTAIPPHVTETGLSPSHVTIRGTLWKEACLLKDPWPTRGHYRAPGIHPPPEPPFPSHKMKVTMLAHTTQLLESGNNED